MGSAQMRLNRLHMRTLNNTRVPEIHDSGSKLTLHYRDNGNLNPVVAYMSDVYI